MNIEERITLWMELHPEPCEERELLNDAAEQLAACRAALTEIDRLERIASYERCPDCDSPRRCTRDTGCLMVQRSGTLVQRVVWKVIGREAARAAGGGE